MPADAHGGAVAALRRVAVAAALLTAGALAHADDATARNNYALHCLGCHLPEARGFPGRVPRMNAFAGYFLHSPEGREYLIRVAGVATAQLSNEAITELMNWMLTTYSAEQLPADFEPYSVAEVGALRQRPEPDPYRARAVILARLAAVVPAVADEDGL
ncbi:MAG: cytochrome c [Pseudomonadota bacterium]